MFKPLLLFSLILCVITDNWNHEEWLDGMNGSFLLKWNLNFKTEIITLRCEVKCARWFSLGLAQANCDTDIVIGWLDDNNTFVLKDCYLRKDSVINIDDQQDYSLQWSERNESHLIFEFERRWKTCDIYDTDITEMASNVIFYSFGSDMVSNVENLTNTVVKDRTKIQLIRPLLETNENLSHVDFVMNVTLPDRQRLYLCQIFKIENPFQVIKFVPVISDITAVHHIQIYQCKHNAQELNKYLGTDGYECEKFPNLAPELQSCLTNYITWTMGVTAIYSDSESAFIFGEDLQYYSLQIHFENPKGLKNRNIRAGLRAYKSVKPRNFAIHEMVMGKHSDNSIIIPPNQSTFIVAGHCLADCFPFNEMKEKFIKLVSVTFHMHLRGKSAKLRHFRNGKELPWIASDNNYLFDRQIKNYLINPVVILPGDIVTLECTYKTLDVNQTVISGHATSEEMCVVLVLYYPRMKNFDSFCLSKYTAETYREITGIKDIIGFGETERLSVINPKDSKVIDLNHYLINKTDWKSSLENTTVFNRQIAQCQAVGVGIKEGKEIYVNYPNIVNPYKPKDICNKNN